MPAVAAAVAVAVVAAVILHSLRSLSYDRSTASSKASSPQVRSSTFSFHFQHTLVSLRSSSICLRLVLCLPVTSIPPSRFTSITCFRKQFIHKMGLISLPSFHCMQDIPLLTDSKNTSSFLTPSFQLTFSILLQHHI